MNILKNFSKQLRMIALLLIYALASNHANATIITEWSYTTWAEWTASAFSSGGGTINNHDDDSNSATPDYELSWGATDGFFNQADAPEQEEPGAPTPAANRSALTIGQYETTQDGGLQVGTVNTIGFGGPDEHGEGISITHWNNPILASYATLMSGQLTDYLTLEATQPDPGPEKDAPTIEFDFNFAETPNAPCGGPGCDDLFGFQTDILGGVLFNYENELYVINLLVDGDPFEELSGTDCTTLGFDGACAGFRTQEAAITTKQFGFEIRHVPEPSTLMLLALGIFFIGARKQRFSVNR